MMVKILPMFILLLIEYGRIVLGNKITFTTKIQSSNHKVKMIKIHTTQGPSNIKSLIKALIWINIMGMIVMEILMKKR